MLFGVNFRPLQEIEAIIGGGQIFDTGSFFTRLQYMAYHYFIVCSIHSAMVLYVKVLNV